MGPIKKKIHINVDLGEAFGNFKCGPDEELIPMIGIGDRSDIGLQMTDASCSRPCERCLWLPCWGSSHNGRNSELDSTTPLQRNGASVDLYSRSRHVRSTISRLEHILDCQIYKDSDDESELFSLEPHCRCRNGRPNRRPPQPLAWIQPMASISSQEHWCSILMANRWIE